MRLKFVVAGLFLVLAIPTFPQAAPSATQGGLPITFGAAVSTFHTDFSRYESGPTVWLDWNFYRGPRFLQGLSIEAEARDLNYDRTGDNPKLRQTTAGGGLLYHWQRWERIRPYGKALLGFGSISFTPRPGSTYSHDTRTVFAPGGGGDFRVWRGLTVRADYEYQFWPDWKNNHAMNPQGLTVGASYDLGHLHAQ
ncbi:MAG TPA: porin family protein [Terracidiphilus sp.]|nr:porin family protein [Terracidiphilus sp.]